MYKCAIFWPISCSKLETVTLSRVFPSNMACSLEGGLYKIFSVGNHGQDADLNGGLPMAPIVGYENNTYSSNMVVCQRCFATPIAHFRAGLLS